ncbi:hypothetical protein ACFX13_034959 [Malus domestica]
MHQKALTDLGYCGPIFTWERDWEEWGKIAERLDQAVANLLWTEYWPDTVISHDPLIGSDHRPLIIQYAHYVALGPCPFSLEAFWLRNYEFQCFAQSSQSNDFQPHAGTKCEVHLTTTKKLGEVWRNEELYWLQRSQINWLRDGDKNTAFFHHSAIQYRQRNRILKIKDFEDVWLEEDGQIRNHIDAYFKTFFSPALEGLKQVVTPQINANLLMPFTLEEIKFVVFE